MKFIPYDEALTEIANATKRVQEAKANFEQYQAAYIEAMFEGALEVDTLTLSEEEWLEKVGYTVCDRDVAMRELYSALEWFGEVSYSILSEKK